MQVLELLLIYNCESVTVLKVSTRTPSKTVTNITSMRYDNKGESSLFGDSHNEKFDANYGVGRVGKKYPR